jgi:RNA polymerase sigma-70 factor (ECF subfamily)
VSEGSVGAAVVGGDPATAAWLEKLAPSAPGRDSAISDLHALLLRATRAEAARRAFRSHIDGPELDDIAVQAANDAVLAVLRQLDTFRGDSRFTTWAYAFAVLEVSSKLGRHFWARPNVALGHEQWDQLPARLGISPEAAAESSALFSAVRAAVRTELTDRQREVFVALVVDGIPLDALVVKLGTNRNALYKVMFDARRKIRAALVTNGYLKADGENAVQK